MPRRYKTRLIFCVSKMREVEVTYTAAGAAGMGYEVVSCPAMYDGGTGCDRRCRSALGSPDRVGVPEFRLSG